VRKTYKKLSLEERIVADNFFERIGTTDSVVVKKLIKVVNSQARCYLFSREIEKIAPHFSGSEVFFAVYGIGGNLTKTGERPDIDIMIATNMRYKKGFMDSFETENDFLYEYRMEPIWRRINHAFGSKMYIDLKGELPDNYNLGVTQGKCIITLTPRTAGRKIDLIYVKSMIAKGAEFGLHQDKFFVSEEDFRSKDVDVEGNPLPKVLLYRSNTNISNKSGRWSVWW